MRFKQIFFLFGPPASGKDTQAKLLAKKLKGRRLTTSEILRKFLQRKKRYLVLNGRKIDLQKEREKLQSGALVDFHLVAFVIIETIKKEKGILIFAGSPRTVVEAKAEYNFLRKENIPAKFIFLDVPYKIAFERSLGRKRKDLPLDAPEIFRKRWEAFEKHTLPAKRFLAKRNALLEIDGSLSVQEVHRAIMSSLSDK